MEIIMRNLERGEVIRWVVVNQADLEKMRVESVLGSLKGASSGENGWVVDGTWHTHYSGVWDNGANKPYDPFDGVLSINKTLIQPKTEGPSDPDITNSSQRANGRYISGYSILLDLNTARNNINKTNKNTQRNHVHI